MGLWTMAKGTLENPKLITEMEKKRENPRFRTKR